MVKQLDELAENPIMHSEFAALIREHRTALVEVIDAMSELGLRMTNLENETKNDHLIQQPDTCSKCGGSGTSSVARTVPCMACHGTGKKPGERKEKVFGAGGDPINETPPGKKPEQPRRPDGHLIYCNSKGPLTEGICLCPKTKLITIKPCCWVCELFGECTKQREALDSGNDYTVYTSYCNGRDFQLKKELPK